jgi:glutaredoxin
MNKLLLYTKPDCQLCDEMKDVISDVKREVNFDFEEINIKQNELFYEKLKEKIPLLMMNGRLIAKYYIDKEKLRKLVTTEQKL